MFTESFKREPKMLEVSIDPNHLFRYSKEVDPRNKKSKVVLKLFKSLISKLINIYH